MQDACLVPEDRSTNFATIVQVRKALARNMASANGCAVSML